MAVFSLIVTYNDKYEIHRPFCKCQSASRVDRKCVFTSVHDTNYLQPRIEYNDHDLTDDIKYEVLYFKFYLKVTKTKWFYNY